MTKSDDQPVAATTQEVAGDAGGVSRRGEETRRRLVTAAAELIPELGWGNVTTRAVAERADVNPALVHYHFGSVADLLRSAVRHATQEMVEQPMAVLLTADDAAVGVREAIGALASLDLRGRESLLLYEAFLAASRDEDLRGDLARLLSTVREQLAVWLGAHGVEDAEGTATLVAAALDGILLHALIDPDVGPRDLATPLLRLLGPTSTGGSP